MPATLIPFEELKPGDHVPDGVPVVKVRDYPNGKIRLENLKRTSHDIANQFKGATLARGDVLISIRGTYGRVAAVPDDLDGGNITQDSARIAPTKAINRQFLIHFLRSPECQIYLRRVARGVAVKGVNIGDLRELRVLLPEIEATLTNLAGVEQAAHAGGKLPGQAREGWRVLRALGGELGLPGFEFSDLAGARALLEGGRRVEVKAGAAGDAGTSGLELALVPAIYRTDAVVRRAAALQAHPLNVEARIVLNPADAGAIGAADGQVAKVKGANGTATLPVVVDDRVAAGAAWIEGGHGATAPLGAGRVEVVKA